MNVDKGHHKCVDPNWCACVLADQSRAQSMERNTVSSSVGGQQT